MTYYRIETTDGARYPLGRHVNHDPRSRAYAYRPAKAASYATVMHERHVPIFDQSNLRSCTGNAAIGCLGTGAFFATVGAGSAYGLDEDGAVACYEEATDIDPYDGSYPPDDTGSDGNSVAMALKNAGMISGYTHAFSLADAMAALEAQPVIFGLNWYEQMFDPGSDGTLHVKGALAGGHEVVLSGYDSATNRVKLDNSWGASWGLQGSAWLQLADFTKLLGQDGDVTVFTPITQPAPTPVDPTDLDAVAVASAVRKALTDLGL